MKFADWLRGVANVVIADVDKVFTVAKSAVSLIPVTNIRNDLTQVLTDAQADLHAWEGLAGSLAAQVAADGIDDVTTLLINQANALSGGNSLSQLSAAEKSILAASWTAIKAQGETIVAQLQAGLDPTAKPAAPQIIQQPTPQATTGAPK